MPGPERDGATVAWRGWRLDRESFPGLADVGYATTSRRWPLWKVRPHGGAEGSGSLDEVLDHGGIEVLGAVPVEGDAERRPASRLPRHEPADGCWRPGRGALTLGRTTRGRG